MRRKVKQRIDLGDRDLLRAGRHLDDLVPGADLALLQDPHVESRPVVADQQGRHLRAVHPYAEPIARDAGLGDFEDCPADPKPIADADLVIRQAVNRQVLAELAVDVAGVAERKACQYW